jgi:putative aldouronate transport system permease protein
MKPAYGEWSDGVLFREFLDKRNYYQLNDLLFRFFNTLFMCFISVIMLYPFMHVIFASISDPNAMMRHRGLLLAPYGVQFDAYRLVLANPNITMGYLNTLFYVVFGTAINMILTILSAFVLSRKNVMFKPFLMIMAVVSMYFSGGLIPLYLQVNKLGLIDTRWAVLLPSAMSTYNMIIMRTSFQSLPDELEESAYIDGANDWVVLGRIVIPLSMSTIAVIVLFYSVGIWNGWFYAMIFLRHRHLYPLQLILREILIANDTSSMTIDVVGDKVPIAESVKYATIVVATLPVLCVYPFLQKYFVKGVFIGALKG